jgi:hypothetical protein
VVEAAELLVRLLVLQAAQAVAVVKPITQMVTVVAALLDKVSLAATQLVTLAQVAAVDQQQLVKHQIAQASAELEQLAAY